MRRRRVVTAVLAAAVLAGVAHAGPARLDLPRRWVYVATNLLVDRNADDLVALMDRTSKCGFNGVALNDSKFGRLADMDARYFRNVERVKAAATRSGVQIVPGVAPVGYSESILSQDPDLAEALPVKDALFVVKDGEARCVADPPVELAGGDFESGRGFAWKDDCVVVEHGVASVADPKGNARIAWRLRVAPFRQYHVSVRVRTRGFGGDARVQAIGADGRALVHSNLGVKRDQAWTEHHAVFNPLGNAEVTVYLGQWGACSGELAWDDARIEEAGLLNVVRRGGAPLTVTTADGRALAEGADFERVADPRMGRVPWPGGYEVWHEPPPIRTRLADGTRLRASFFHAITVGDGQVSICPSETKTVDLLRDQIRRVHAAWGASGYFLQHDEIRVLGWDDSCARRKLTAGQILADDVKTCVRLVRETAPKADVYVWSDMFDPNHNAHAGYYLVNGDLAGSWEGLDPDVVVVPWYFEKRAESLAFFAARGNRTLLAGYYDSAPEPNVKGWLDAARGVKGVVGIMYTTWRGSYGDLERFARAVEDDR
jgi:hypothetical protein